MRIKKTDDDFVIFDLLNEYKSSNNNNLKEKLKTVITSKMVPIVKRIATTIARRSYDPVEDLVQAGFIGVLKAIDKYDAEKNDNFRIFAGYFIIGEMRHYLRDKLDTIRIPGHIQELAIRINSFMSNLTYEEIQELTSDEVASALQIPKKAVDMVLVADRRRRTISFEEIYNNGTALSFEELIGNKDYKEKIIAEDNKIMLNDIIQILPSNLRVLIKLYYEQDMSKSEIAKYMHWPKTRVVRGLERAFKIIYDNYNESIDEI